MGAKRASLRAGETTALWVHRVQTAPAHLLADLRIEPAGRGDAGPAGQGQVGDAQIGALVEPVRGLQQSLQDPAKGGAPGRGGQPGIRVHARVAQPVPGQVETAPGRIFADVPGDVGELHGHPEVAGAGHQDRVPHTHQECHHGPHGTGYPGAVAVEGGEVFVAAPLGVPGEALDQGLQQPPGDGELPDHVGQGPIRWIPEGPTGIDPVQAPIQVRQGSPWVIRQVYGVVRQSAEGVEGGGRLPHPARQ